MEYVMIVEADENDADYVKGVQFVDEATKLRVEELFSRIKNMKRCGDVFNSPPSEMYPELTPEEIEFINGVVPWGTYGIHTIECITFCLLSGKREKTNLSINWNIRF